MAEVKARRVIEATDGRDAAPAPATGDELVPPLPPIDPRAVRVRPAPGTEPGGVVLLVAPPPEPLRMGNPSVGRGPFGGTLVTESGPDGADDPEGVFAQRHPLLDGAPAEVAVHHLGGDRYRLVEAGRTTRVVLGPPDEVGGGVLRRDVLVDGFTFQVDVESERIAGLRERASRGRAASAHAGPLQVRAIIPGKVVGVSIVVGDEVTAGQQLLVVEAMKMQNELRAPRDGTIERLGVAPGVNIEVGDLLVVIS